MGRGYLGRSGWGGAGFLNTGPVNQPPVPLPEAQQAALVLHSCKPLHYLKADRPCFWALQCLQKREQQWFHLKQMASVAVWQKPGC